MVAEFVGRSDFYSYDLTVETPISIDEMIYMLSPLDLPLTTGVNADGVPLIPRQPVDNRIFYWMEEELSLPRALINEALDDSETAWTLDTGAAVKFAVGDAIRCEDEVVKVTAVDTSTDVLTVVRAYAGTSAAAHADNSELIGLGTILPEGDIGSGAYQGRVKIDNYTQIWSRRIQVSRTEQRIRKYGVPNELNKQILANQHALWLGVEQAALYGIKYEQSASRIRSTGGLDSFIDANIEPTDDWLTITNIEEQQQLAYDAGGMFTVVCAKPAHFRHLNNITGENRIQTVTVDDARRGRTRAQIVTTEFGDVQLVRNRWVRATDAFGYNPENFVMRVLQPMIVEKLAKSDDTDTFMMVMEAGFQVKGPDHMAKWNGLNLAGALPTEGT